jgi:hypothetical protein
MLNVGADSPHEQLRRTSFADTLAWSEEEGASHILGDAVNRVVRYPRRRSMRRS